MKEKNTFSPRPIVKWAGGKKKLAPEIEQIIQGKIDIKTIDTYVEPFIGGGAMFFYLSSKYKFKKRVIMDLNFELISLYRTVQNSPRELITNLDMLENNYNALDSLDEKKEMYLTIRKQYNTLIESEQSNSVEAAGFFLFLNKVGFNGLYRVNQKGLFNVPFGQRKIASLYDETNLMDVSQMLQGVDIIHGDYKNSEKFAGENTLFYFDPPYRPLTKSASFTSYAKSEFNDDSQKELSEFVKKISSKGANFGLSNSDPAVNEDDFFDVLYSDFEINRITAGRAISAKASGRKSVSEIVVIG